MNTELSDAPILKKLKEKEDGFEVPFHYFSKLEDEVMGKLFQVNHPKSKVELFFEYWINVLGSTPLALRIAAVVGLVFVSTLFIGPGVMKVKQEVAMEEIPSKAIEQYILDNLEDFDTELLSDFWEESQDTEPAPFDEVFEEIIDEIELEDLESLL